ncbi:hypothetical protein F0726_01984 [Acidithiobacillus caldus]|nr:hypothetical protein F0726_01984 [Acidithiobacillus caldus]
MNREVSSLEAGKVGSQKILPVVIQLSAGLRGGDQVVVADVFF